MRKALQPILRRVLFKSILTDVLNTLYTFFQYLTLKGSDIISKDGGYVMENKGTGGEIVDAPILNTQIATFDGTATLQATVDLELYGITITEFTGTSTPTINGDMIDFTAGTFEHMKLSNGDEYYGQAGNGVTLYSNGKIHNLFTRVVGDGTISPTSGTYDDGDIVVINADPLDPLVSELSDITVNTVSVGNTSPYSLLMDGVKDVVAYFSSIYTTILDVFSTAPVLIDGVYKFADSSGFVNNIQVIKTPCIQLNGIDNYVDIPANNILDFNSDFILEIEFIHNTTVVSTIFSWRKNIALEWFELRVNTQNRVTFTILNSSSIISPLETLLPNVLYKVKLTRVGDLFSLYLNNSLMGTLTRASVIQSNIKSEIGANNFFSTNIYTPLIGKLISFNYNNGELYIPLMRAPYDVSGNGIHGILRGDLTSINSTEDNITPYYYTNGFSFDGSNIVPALLDGLTDAQGNAIQYPINSGVIDGLPNEYVIPVNTELNTIIPAGNYTWAQLDALVTSANLIKTKPNATTISRLVAKKKLTSEGLTIYTRDTVYTIDSIYTI